MTKDHDSIKKAVKAVRAGMGVRTAATKYGLTRDRLRYYIQKADAERARFRNAIAEENR